jgi:hypothetical protein
MLERTYIEHHADGLMNLQVELNGVIIEALWTSELYNNYDKDYWEHGWTNKSFQVHQTSSMRLSVSTRREKMGNTIKGI